jgi:hypothetical protein
MSRLIGTLTYPERTTPAIDAQLGEDELGRPYAVHSVEKRDGKTLVTLRLATPHDITRWHES